MKIIVQNCAERMELTSINVKLKYCVLVHLSRAAEHIEGNSRNLAPLFFVFALFEIESDLLIH